MKGNSSKLTYKFCFKLKMANKLSVMANPIRNIISGNRHRLKDDKYNLDLVYVNDNIIAMGFPANNIEAIYRNNIEDVVKFFNENHRDHYKVYNLCCEKKYDTSKFNDRVGCFPFVDHCPPTIELIYRFCDDVHKFLMEDTKNVVAIHCKAGKGRTGTMISCYLIYSKMVKNDIEALEFYGQKRTTDGKGVTIPSQRRYVNYFSRLINDNLEYRTKPLEICEIQLSSAPLNTTSVSLQICTLQKPEDPVAVTKCETIPLDCSKNLRILFGEKNMILSGDVKIELKNLFHFWFNTFFVHMTADCEGEGDNMRYKFVLSKNELDGAHKDKNHHFAKDFKVTVYLKPYEDYQNHNSSAYKSQNTTMISNHHQNNYGNNRISAPIIQNNSNHQTQVKQQMQRKSIPLDRRNNEGQLFFFPPQTHPNQQTHQQQQNHTSSSSYNNYTNYFVENNSTTAAASTGLNNHHIAEHQQQHQQIQLQQQQQQHIQHQQQHQQKQPTDSNAIPVENSNSCGSVSNQSASNTSTTSSSSSTSSSVDVNGEDWESGESSSSTTTSTTTTTISTLTTPTKTTTTTTPTITTTSTTNLLYNFDAMKSTIVVPLLPTGNDSKVLLKNSNCNNDDSSMKTNNNFNNVKHKNSSSKQINSGNQNNNQQKQQQQNNITSNSNNNSKKNDSKFMKLVALNKSSRNKSSFKAKFLTSKSTSKCSTNSLTNIACSSKSSCVMNSGVKEQQPTTKQKVKNILQKYFKNNPDLITSREITAPVVIPKSVEPDFFQNSIKFENSLQKSKIFENLPQEPDVLEISSQEPKIFENSPQEPKVLEISPQEPKILENSPQETKILEITPHEPKILEVSPQEPKILEITLNEPKILENTKYISPHESKTFPIEPKNFEIPQKEPKNLLDRKISIVVDSDHDASFWSEEDHGSRDEDEEESDSETDDDHDYYSSICDNQLSFNNSPCKSPSVFVSHLETIPSERMLEVTAAVPPKSVESHFKMSPPSSSAADVAATTTTTTTAPAAPSLCSSSSSSSNNSSTSSFTSLSIASEKHLNLVDTTNKISNNSSSSFSLEKLSELNVNSIRNDDFSTVPSDSSSLDKNDMKNQII